MSVAWTGRARIYLALAPRDMRKGFDGLSAEVSHVLGRDPFSEHLFVFRSKRGDRLKALWWDGSGFCLLAKRLERGRFVWPRVKEGAITLTPAQLGLLLEGLDWRRAIPLAGEVRPTAV